MALAEPGRLMPRRLTKDRRRLATQLSQIFGGWDAGEGARVSATEAAARLLPFGQQRTPRTKDVVGREMSYLQFHGWVQGSPGPRGGKGWALSAAGAALLARVIEEDRAAQCRVRETEAAKEAAKLLYHADLVGPDGRERIAVRALGIEEAMALVGREARGRWTGTRVVAVWEDGALAP